MQKHKMKGVIIMNQLPDSELDIMLIIWRASEEKSSVNYINQELLKQKKITSGALHSYLNRLVDKGFLECYKEGKYRYFKPLISESEYKQENGKHFLDKLFGGSLSNLANCLYKKNKLSNKDLKELKKFVELYSEDETK